MKILNILCEGVTEELFVKRVLKEHLSAQGVIVKAQLLLTNSKLNARGGILSYQQVKGDLQRWVKVNAGKKNEEHYYTTMIDLYALPDDFPEYKEAVKVMDVYQRVRKLEEGFGNDMNMSDFIPYIQLHEYEALVFCGLEFLPEYYPQSAQAVKKLQKVLEQFSGNPEKIDSGRTTVPSKRLGDALSAVHYHYEKTRVGVEIALRVGLPALRERCRHFDAWIQRLEQI